MGAEDQAEQRRERDDVQIPLVLEDQRRPLGEEEDVADQPAADRREQREDEDADEVIALLDRQQRPRDREQEHGRQLESYRELELARDGGIHAAACPRPSAYFLAGATETSVASVQVMSTRSPTATCCSAFLSCTLLAYVHPRGPLKEIDGTFRSIASIVAVIVCWRRGRAGRPRRRCRA